MRLSLHPDPDVGRHWRLSLEIGGIELSCDVAERHDPSRRKPVDPGEFESALATARAVAAALGFVYVGEMAWAIGASRGGW